MQPLLSICIPTHNRSQTLKEALDAYVKSKDFDEDVEIVVSDNASTDGTMEMVEKYAEKYPNIRYFRNNENIHDRNFSRVLDLARGVYIKLQNDNDVFTDYGIGYLKEKIRDNINEKRNIFFTNSYIYTVKKAEKINCDSLDDFIGAISTFATKINCFGAWKENWDKIENKNKYADLQLQQEEWFFQIVSVAGKCVIHDGKYAYSRYPERKKEQSYNWFKVHLDNYYKIMDVYVKKGLVSKKTYSRDKRNLFKHFLPEIVKVVYRDKSFPYETKRTFYYFFKHYKMFISFWLFILTLPLWCVLVCLSFPFYSFVVKRYRKRKNKRTE